MALKIHVKNKFYYFLTWFYLSKQVGSKSTEDGTGWTVEREEVNKPDQNGFAIKVKQVWLLVHDDKVKQSLRQCMHSDNRLLEKVPFSFFFSFLSIFFPSPSFLRFALSFCLLSCIYSVMEKPHWLYYVTQVPKLPLDDVFTVLPALQTNCSNWTRHGGMGEHALAPLLKFLEEEYKEKLKVIMCVCANSPSQLMRAFLCIWCAFVLMCCEWFYMYPIILICKFLHLSCILIYTQ